MTQMLDITGLTLEQIQEVQLMIETFRNINQQNNEGDRLLIDHNTSPLTNAQTIVKKYAKNRNLAEELIAERHRESIHE
jgi:hypothetical protein